MSITKEKKEQLIADFGIAKGDTGSAPVQIAILTERINNLTEHMKIHRHDFITKRGLLCLVSARTKLLKYLKRKDAQAYADLIKKLGLRK